MTKFFYLIAAFAACLLLLTSCLGGSDENPYEENLKKGQEFMEANAKRQGVITTPSGLQYEILSEGKEDGKSPKATDKVRCHYKGTFIDGKEFDSSYKYGKPAELLAANLRRYTKCLL